jgi:hypothetical protein
MNRSPYAESFQMSPEVVTFFGSVQGAGAAIPVIPTTTQSTTSSIQPMTAANNYVSGTSGDITRSGVGVYTLKLKDSIPVILDIAPNIWGTDGKWCQITDYNPTTRIVSLKVFAAAGAAADLASTDNLKLTITGQLSVFP